MYGSTYWVMSRNAPLVGVDPRMRILCALAVAIALTFLDLSEADYVIMMIVVIMGVLLCVALTLLMGIPLVSALKRSSVVLPFAGGIAVFAPLAQIESWSLAGIGTSYQTGWPLIVDILFKSWCATYVVLLVIQSMSIEQLIRAFSQLKVPHIFITLFTFLYRFTDLFREQIRIMRDAARSRAPHLHGWRLLVFYGKMSGNLFIRAYERAEQIHGAMLSRGYDGTLPIQ